MELLLILFLILLNGVLAMSEIAVVSARPTRLQQWSKEGDARARAALELHNSPNVFLSTIQIGITAIGVLTGAIGQAAIVDDLAGYLATVPRLAPYSQGLALALVVAGITYLFLILGELVPKRLGLQHPERIARRVAGPMRVLARVTYPGVRLLTYSMDAVLRLLRVRPVPKLPVTEEEIKSLIEESTRAGIFVQAEQELLKNVIRLADRTMGMLMQPRGDIVWLDLEDPIDVNTRKITREPHSRYPVVRGGLDNVVGVVQAKDMLAYVLSGNPLDIERAMRVPLHVPETMTSLRLLEAFKSTPDRLALVVDEYGDLRGMVTLNDILEAIVGGLTTETEPAEPDIVRREDGSWLVDGMLSVEEFKEALDIPALPEEEAYETIGGFVMTQMGRVPAIAEHFEWGGWRFEIVDMDGNRIDRVLVAPVERREL